MSKHYNKAFYEQSVVGYAYHKIILNEKGEAVDYVFLETNRTFEEMTGLKESKIKGKKVTNVLPNIKDDDIDWIGIYGEIALNNGYKNFEAYSQPLNKWYKISAFSDKEGYFITILSDITEEVRKRNELESFFDVNLDLLCIADTEGYFLKLNREWEKTLGYSIKDLEGKRFLDFVHPEDLSATLEAISELKGQKQVLSFVNRYRCQSGSYKHIEWRSNPQGKLIYAAARDVTERVLENQKRELLLSVSEKLLQVTVDDIDYQFFTEIMLKLTDAKYAIFNQYDSEGLTFSTKAISGVNQHIRRASEVLGMSFIGKTWQHDPRRAELMAEKKITRVKSLSELTGDILPKTAIRQLERLFDLGEVVLIKIFRDEKMIGDFTLIMPNRMEFKESIFVEFFTRQVGQLITRIEAEKALFESELKFQSVVESQTEMICRSLPDTTLTYANEVYCRVFNKTREELLGTKFIESIPEAERADVIKHLAGFSKDKRSSAYDHRTLLPDGTAVWQQWVDTAFFDSKDKVIEFQSVGRDITLRKEHELRKDLAVRLFDTLNRTNSVSKLIEDMLQMIKDSLEVEAVGIRLKEGDEYPYYETNGFPPHFVESENRLCSFSDCGYLKDENGETVLECLCGRVIKRELDLDHPFFTKHGSFWTNNLSSLVAEDEGKYRELCPRERCIKDGYQSVALIPLVAGETVIGLIQLNDKRENLFTLDLIEFFEGIGASIGIAMTRRQNLEALKISEAKIQSIFKGAPAGIGVVVNRVFTEVNQYMTELTGYAYEELIGKSSRMLYMNDEDYNYVGSEKYRQINQRGIGVVETRFKCKDGTLKDILLSSAGIASDGLSQGVTFTAIDITKQKQSEKELTKKENQYRELVESTEAIVWEYDVAEDEWVYVSPQGKQILGFNQEEWQGLSFWKQRLHPEDREWASKYCVECTARGEPHTFEYRFRAKDGRYIWLRDVVSVEMLDGKPVRLRGFMIDVSERKKTEIKLKESEEKLLSIFKAIPAGIGVVVRRKIIETNEEMCNLLGYNYEELLNKPASFVYPSIEEYEKVRVETNQQISDKGKGIVETLFKKKEGAIINVLLSASPIYLADNVRGVTFTALDITDKKLIEEALNQSQKMESIGKLAGGVAHDSNNMLMVILNFAEIALKEAGQNTSLSGYLQEIKAAAMRSSVITRQLLAFARKQTIKPEIIDLNTAIGEMFKMMKNLIFEEIDFVWEPTDSLWRISIDPAQIDQVLANLVINAQEAIEGNGKIIIESENVAVDEAFFTINAEIPEGDYVVLRVTDTGTGMTDEVKKQLFVPFFSTKGQGKNTGLGLATVFGIVKQNGGYISVESEPGKGSTFDLFFPRFSGNSELIAEVEKAKSVVGSETILLVDDEIGILEVVKPLLERYGYEIITANSPNIALEFIQRYEKKIDLLITDVVMPELNGQELMEKVRETYPEIKTLFMSGYTNNVIAHRGVLEDGIHFLQKPFLAKTMAEKIREIFDHS